MLIQQRPMLIQQQPNSWSCLPTAFAIAVEMTVKDFINLIGHDGSEIVRPDYSDPFCRKAFNIIECIHVMYDLGFSVTPFDAKPASAINNKEPVQIWSDEESDKRINKILSSEIGVITGYVPNAHSVVWDGTKIINPSDMSYQNLDYITIETFWVIQSIAKNNRKTVIAIGTNF